MMNNKIINYDTNFSVFPVSKGWGMTSYLYICICIGIGIGIGIYVYVYVYV